MTAIPPIGSAPVSYGVYGAQAGGPAASPEQLLASIASAGYAGSELGPPGFFGPREQAAARFAAAGLRAVGAYVPVHFAAGDEQVRRDLAGLHASCQELAACGGGLAILADEGSPELLAHPARAWDDRALALDEQAWHRLSRLVGQCTEIVAGYGLPASFHPHISTYVESPWEIERLLELTDIPLTLDIGHLQLAGGDPVQALRAWRARINHVHVKDISLAVLNQAKASGRADFDTWWAGVATPLGAGDVDIDAVLAGLAASGYAGWLVIEQDRAPTPASGYAAVAAEQQANRRWLAGALGRHFGPPGPRGRAER